MTWDFSKAGALDGVKEFFWSLLKTALTVIVAYALLRLANIHLDVHNNNFDLYTGIIIIGRALLSGFGQWVTTLPGTVTDTTPVTVG